MFLQVFTGGGLVLLCLFSPLCVSPFQFDTSWGMWTSVGVVCYMFSNRVYWGAAGVIVQLVKHLVKQKGNMPCTSPNGRSILKCYISLLFDCYFQLFMCSVSFLSQTFFINIVDTLIHVEQSTLQFFTSGNK